MRDKRIMKNLLWISYEFPPFQGAEGILSAKLIKHLSILGWKCHVVTIKTSTSNLSDNTLLSELHSTVSIHRTYSLEPWPINYILNKLNINPKWIYLVDHRIGWLPFAVNRSKKVLKKEKIDAIVSRSTPVVSHLIALKLKSLTGLPWIADFSDPWTQNQYFVYPNKYIRKLNGKLEYKVASSADAIVFRANYAKLQFLEKYKMIPETKVKVIPNFYDSADFIEPEGNKKNKFTITYTGNFMGTRSPEPLFKALKILTDEKDINGKIIVKLIGYIGDFKNLISKYELSDIVQIIDTIPRSEVFTHLYNTDVLLLIDAPSNGPSVFLPSKLPEYIRIGKPILAITPEIGESADVVRATKTGLVVSPEDIEGIKESIKKYYEQYMSSSLEIQLDWNEISKYSAEKCAEQLNNILRGLIE